MGLVLDTLKDHDECVIYNNTNGVVIVFYGGDSFIEELYQEFRIDRDKILNYFTKNEIIDFFNENNMDLEKLKEVIEWKDKKEKSELETLFLRMMV